MNENNKRQTVPPQIESKHEEKELQRKKLTQFILQNEARRRGAKPR